MRNKITKWLDNLSDSIVVAIGIVLGALVSLSVTFTIDWQDHHKPPAPISAREDRANRCVTYMLWSVATDRVETGMEDYCRGVDLYDAVNGRVASDIIRQEELRRLFVASVAVRRDGSSLGGAPIVEPLFMPGLDFHGTPLSCGVTIAPTENAR